MTVAEAMDASNRLLWDVRHGDTDDPQTVAAVRAFDALCDYARIKLERHQSGELARTVVP